MNENKPPTENGFFAGIRRSNLLRSRERWIGGVSGAVATRTGLDLTLIRGLFIVAGLFGIGFLAYGLAWIFLPEEGTGKILAEDLGAGKIEGPFIAAAIFVLIGFWAPFNLARWTFSDAWWLVPNGIGVAITVIVLLIIFSKKSTPGAPPQSPSSSASSYSSASSASPASSAWPDSPQSPDAGQTPPTSPYSQPPVGSYSQAAPPPPPSPSPAPAPEASAPRAPLAMVAAFVGLALIAAAIIALMQMNTVGDNWWLTPVGAAVIVLGLGTIAAGFIGRTSSWMSALAVIAVLVTVAGSSGWMGTGPLVGDVTWKPKTSAVATLDRSTGIGTIEADLRDVPMGGPDEAINVRFAIGDASVIVPDDRRVVVSTALNIGDIKIPDHPDADRSGLFMGRHTYVLGEEFPAEDQLEVSVAGLIGDITITTAQPTRTEIGQ